MKSEQRRWSADSGWICQQPTHCLGDSARLVFIFGGVDPVKDSGCFDLARSHYPNAHVVGCTTAGEIQAASVTQDSVVMTAVAFDHTEIATSQIHIDNPGQSRNAAEQLVRKLPAADLSHVFLLSDGLRVNGSEMVRGVIGALPPKVTVTGGFAADGDRLRETHVWCDSSPEPGLALAVGFYGNRLKVHTAVTGAWGPFGPDRLITKAQGNILYELDGRSALVLYKTYLGEYASQLPASGLLFPLLIHAPGSDQCVLRALIGIDESEQSITFAGDIIEGSYARLMRGTIERLIEGTFETANSIRADLGARSPDLSIIVSCNGRRHVLKQRIEEEVAAVHEVLGAGTITGFYSYGEIGPISAGEPSELHNETMNITTFSEG